MLSLKDCMAMTDTPEHELLELAIREHLPVMLAVAIAEQRCSRPERVGSGDVFGDSIRCDQSLHGNT